MRRRAVIAVLIATVYLGACPAIASRQTPPPAGQPAKHQPGFTDMFADYTRLLGKKYPSASDVKKAADQLLKKYAPLLKDIKPRIDRWVKSVETDLANLELKEKLKLALELWRIRGSLDLLSLGDPEMIEQITGISPAEMQRLQETFKQAEKRMGSLIPVGL
jgi:hypothetical protein